MLAPTAAKKDVTINTFLSIIPCKSATLCYNQSWIKLVGLCYPVYIQGNIRKREMEEICICAVNVKVPEATSAC